MGLVNVKVMVPFRRRVEEARRVLDVMAAHGLRQGESGLETTRLVLAVEGRAGSRP